MLFLAGMLLLGQQADAQRPAAKASAAPVAAPPVVVRHERLKMLPSPSDASLAAWLDLSKNVPRDRQANTWYVWDNIGAQESAAAINFTINAVLSQATSIVQAVIVRGAKEGEGPILLRYDLVELAPIQKDRDRIFTELQKLADFEPYFHQPLKVPRTRKVKKVATRKVAKEVKVPVPEYGATAYKLETKIEDVTSEIEVEETYGGKTEFGLHAGGAGPLQLLSDQAGYNLLPIVRADWFLATAWSSVDIGGVKGRYYELAGILKSEEKGKTDFDLFLENVGADPKLVAKLRADQRSVMISGVTGKWRQVEAFFAVGVRPEFGPSLVTITHDIKDDEFDAKRHALLNLVAFDDQAREVIAAKRNGLHLFLLTDGKGAIQLEAPPDVAAWPNSPHTTKRLSAGISCVECHGGNRGYNPTENYIKDLIRRGFTPLADLTVDGKDGKLRLSPDTLDLLKGKYDGDLNIPLKDAGNAYARAMDRATRGVFGVRSVEGASAEVVRIYNDYFARVTPQKLLRELGYELVGKPAIAAANFELDAGQLLAKIVPPAVEEDGRIGAIRLGLPILRSDVHEIYYELKLRELLAKP